MTYTIVATWVVCLKNALDTAGNPENYRQELLLTRNGQYWMPAPNSKPLLTGVRVLEVTETFIFLIKWHNYLYTI